MQAGLSTVAPPWIPAFAGMTEGVVPDMGTRPRVIVSDS